MNHLDPAAREQLRPVPGRCGVCGMVAMVHPGKDGLTCEPCATAPAGPETAAAGPGEDMAGELRALRHMYPLPLEGRAEVGQLWADYVTARQAVTAAEVALRTVTGHAKTILADGVHVATRCQRPVTGASWVSDYFQSVKRGNHGNDTDD